MRPRALAAGGGVFGIPGRPAPHCETLYDPSPPKSSPAERQSGALHDKGRRDATASITRTSQHKAAEDNHAHYRRPFDDYRSHSLAERRAGGGGVTVRCAPSLLWPYFNEFLRIMLFGQVARANPCALSGRRRLFSLGSAALSLAASAWSLAGANYRGGWSSRFSRSDGGHKFLLLESAGNTRATVF
ncbi:hypothetical protein MRX96_030935 [Rhipicephalus microplus]